jgi:hypothetical protein
LQLKKFGLKKDGLELECPIVSYYCHKMFPKHVKISLCINAQKSKSYEKERKINPSYYKKKPHPLIMWQHTPANVELITILRQQIMVLNTSKTQTK